MRLCLAFCRSGRGALSRIADRRELTTNAREERVLTAATRLESRAKQLGIGQEAQLTRSVEVIETARESLDRARARLDRAEAALELSNQRIQRDQAEIDREMARTELDSARCRDDDPGL